MQIEKEQYHCDACGICRIGGRENFFHCDRCGTDLLLIFWCLPKYVPTYEDLINACIGPNSSIYRCGFAYADHLQSMLGIILLIYFGGKEVMVNMYLILS